VRRGSQGGSQGPHPQWSHAVFIQNGENIVNCWNNAVGFATYAEMGGIDRNSDDLELAISFTDKLRSMVLKK